MAIINRPLLTDAPAAVEAGNGPHNTTAHVIIGGTRYGWDELVVSESVSDGWAHHGIDILSDGSVVTAAPDQASVVVLGLGQRRRFQFDTDLSELHGITVSRTAEGDVLWLVDNGHKFLPASPRYGEKISPGRVVAMTLDGRQKGELLAPQIAAYAARPWAPCALVIDESPGGGTGDVWVADGYGASLLHRFRSDGTHRATIDGGASGRTFDTPHDVMIDTRRGAPELYVADRANRRIVVLDLEGRFLRTVGEGVLSSPSAFAVSEDLLFVAELYGSLAVFDRDDRFEGFVCWGDDHNREGWPNTVDGAGAVTRPPLRPGALNSPHGLAVDQQGAVYVTEWLIGGRVVRLFPG
ncbi:MAG TPA: hypothetical protein VGH27_29815 [Streptosporangiaceae bacterium]|jgi:hypothetical protein